MPHGFSHLVDVKRARLRTSGPSRSLEVTGYLVAAYPSLQVALWLSRKVALLERMLAVFALRVVRAHFFTDLHVSLTQSRR